MRKVKSGKILLKDIKHIANSRLRNLDDVSDLMRDIEQHGQFQPIGLRVEDNAIIFGNRRERAFINLNYETIDCEWFADVSDDDLLIMNVNENIKRKDIGSIEIGRICQTLIGRNMTTSEISEKLGISKTRVNSAVSAYNITKGTPFEKLVIFGKIGGASKNSGIPETVLWKLNEIIIKIRRDLPDAEWNVLLKACESGRLDTKNMALFRNILLSNEDISMTRALEVIEQSENLSASLSVDKVVLAKEKRRLKLDSNKDFIKYLIIKHNRDLLF